MKKHLLYLLPLLFLLALSPLWADDYVDDAYYWEGSQPQVVVTTNTKVRVQQTDTLQNTKQQKVQIIQANDTVVKAVIRR